MNKVPLRQQLMKPVIDALSELGGSGSTDEIREKVISSLKIPNDLANAPHKTKRGATESRTELEYNLAWARTYLRQMGMLQNSVRGIWSLTEKGKKPSEIKSIENISSDSLNESSSIGWKEQLVAILVGELKPAAFERLIQRILRETGFVQVMVTGRSGDGGIDGKGIAKINGILSFHVVFQCKRYKGGVGAPEIRDFRGALQGRADKGLFITTGYFTREAIKEATRDGAIAIDLVDGEKLAEKLKDLGLGIKVELTESISVDRDWFISI